MIYPNHSDFLQAVKDCLTAALVDPASSKKNAVFEIGDSLRGFSLTVNGDGWTSRLNGVSTHGHKHIAAPLSNLQAAYVVLHD